MYKKLDETNICDLLETGIDEFAQHGLDRSNINTIAKRAGLSVGVIYKYFQDKDTFFLACVQHSLKLLEDAMQEVIQDEDDIVLCIEHLIDCLIAGAREHRNYYVLYNEITSGSCRKYAKELAASIEGRTSAIYAKLLEKAQAEGSVKYQGNPRMFAFFFDNLLMMLQFSFSCEYYRERLKIFCGEQALENPEMMNEAFVGFVKQTLGVM